MHPIARLVRGRADHGARAVDVRCRSPAGASAISNTSTSTIVTCQLSRPGIDRNDVVRYRLANGKRWDGGAEAFVERSKGRLAGKKSRIETVESMIGRVVQVRSSGPILPPLAKSGRPYSDTTTAETIASAAAHVVVIGDAKDDDAAFRSARDKVGEAERISFLGFGYHPKSVSRLGVFGEPWDDSRRADLRVNGTSMGLSAPVWQQTKDGAAPPPLVRRGALQRPRAGLKISRLS